MSQIAPEKTQDNELDEYQEASTSSGVTQHTSIAGLNQANEPDNNNGSTSSILSQGSNLLGEMNPDLLPEPDPNNPFKEGVVTLFSNDNGKIATESIQYQTEVFDPDAPTNNGIPNPLLAAQEAMALKNLERKEAQEVVAEKIIYMLNVLEDRVQARREARKSEDYRVFGNFLVTNPPEDYLSLPNCRVTLGTDSKWETITINPTDDQGRIITNHDSLVITYDQKSSEHGYPVFDVIALEIEDDESKEELREKLDWPEAVERFIPEVDLIQGEIDTLKLPEKERKQNGLSAQAPEEPSENTSEMLELQEDQKRSLTEQIANTQRLVDSYEDIVANTNPEDMSPGLKERLWRYKSALSSKEAQLAALEGRIRTTEEAIEAETTILDGGLAERAEDITSDRPEVDALMKLKMLQMLKDDTTQSDFIRNHASTLIDEYRYTTEPAQDSRALQEFAQIARQFAQNPEGFESQTLEAEVLAANQNMAYLNALNIFLYNHDQDRQGTTDLNRQRTTDLISYWTQIQTTNNIQALQDFNFQAITYIQTVTTNVNSMIQQEVLEHYRERYIPNDSNTPQDEIIIAFNAHSQETNQLYENAREVLVRFENETDIPIETLSESLYTLELFNRGLVDFYQNIEEYEHQRENELNAIRARLSYLKIIRQLKKEGDDDELYTRLEEVYTQGLASLESATYGSIGEFNTTFDTFISELPRSINGRLTVHATQIYNELFSTNDENVSRTIQLLSETTTETASLVSNARDAQIRLSQSRNLTPQENEEMITNLLLLKSEINNKNAEAKQIQRRLKTLELIRIYQPELLNSEETPNFNRIGNMAIEDMHPNTFLNFNNQLDEFYNVNQGKISLVAIALSNEMFLGTINIRTQNGREEIQNPNYISETDLDEFSNASPENEASREELRDVREMLKDPSFNGNSIETALILLQDFKAKYEAFRASQ